MKTAIAAIARRLSGRSASGQTWNWPSYWW